MDVDSVLTPFVGLDVPEQFHTSCLKKLQWVESLRNGINQQQNSNSTLHCDFFCVRQLLPPAAKSLQLL